MEQFIIPAGAIVALIFVIWFLVWITKRITPHSKREAIQHEINKRASQQPDGPGAGLKRKKGCAFVFWLIVAIGVAYLLLSSGILEDLM